MDNYITRQEHNEYAKRMDEEHKRQNHRISDLEIGLKETNSLALSVQELAINMKSMLEEQRAQGKRLESQGERLDKLEGRDGEMWRKVTSHLLTTALGILVGYILKQIGIF